MDVQVNLESSLGAKYKLLDLHTATYPKYLFNYCSTEPMCQYATDDGLLVDHLPEKQVVHFSNESKNATDDGPLVDHSPEKQIVHFSNESVKG